MREAAKHNQEQYGYYERPPQIQYQVFAGNFAAHDAHCKLPQRSDVCVKEKARHTTDRGPKHVGAKRISRQPIKNNSADWWETTMQLAQGMIFQLSRSTADRVPQRRVSRELSPKPSLATSDQRNEIAVEMTLPANTIKNPHHSPKKNRLPQRGRPGKQKDITSCKQQWITNPGQAPQLITRLASFNETDNWKEPEKLTARAIAATTLQPCQKYAANSQHLRVCARRSCANVSAVC